MYINKKILYAFFIILFLSLFAAWQIFILKKIPNTVIFSHPILPNGVCKDCNVILISLDTLRAKSLPCYGYKKNTAPNLCEFAKKSFLFKNTYSQDSSTLTSHFSIFTSLYPSAHNVLIPFVSSLSSKVATLTEILKQNNYKNYFLSTLSDHNLPIDKGLERGFDKLIDADDPDLWIANLKTLDISKNKFFAFLHTYAVHSPYHPEKETILKFSPYGIKAYISQNELCQKTYEIFRVKYPERFNSDNINQQNKGSVDYCTEISLFRKKYTATVEEYSRFSGTRLDIYWDIFKNLSEDEKKEYIPSLYEAKIYELDLGLKRFFDFLKEKDLLKNTIVVITSDHGEEFLEHRGRTHSETLYNEVIRIPLLIYIPNSKPQAINKLTQSIDIMPTILSILGLSIPTQTEGINIFSKKSHEYVISQRLSRQKEAIISQDWKLIINSKDTSNPSKELYNLQNDPEEQHNVASKYPQQLLTLEKKLIDFHDKEIVYSNKDNKPFPTWINEEQRKKLRETGYF